MEEANMLKMPHHIIIEERKAVSLAGVVEVLSFDETSVLMQTTLGQLMIRGMELHILKTDVESGEVLLQGEVCELFYSTSKRSEGGNGLFSRLFRMS